MSSKRPSSTFRSISRPCLGALACLILQVTAALAAPADKAQTGPGFDEAITPLESLRGFRSNEPFFAGDSIESINVSNGNMVLRVPLGQRYNVGPILSYQLAVTHNSDVWEHTRIDCEGSSNPSLCNTVFKPVDMAVPNPQSNAGLGWELHFGKLYPPIPPDDAPWTEKQTWPNRDLDGTSIDAQTRWLYVSPDGASHTLHYLSGWPGVGAGARYAKDGSQLRLVPRSATLMEVQHPNGVVSKFVRTNDQAGTLVCGPGRATGCWRFSEMTDPYGNFVRVTYALSGSEEHWNVTDTTGRGHRVVFALDAATVGRLDATPNQLTNGEGSELGDLRRVLERVEVAAFGDTTATYTFNTSVRRVSRGCPNNTNSDGAQEFHDDNFEISVPVLESIDPPEGLGWVFETAAAPGLGCSLGNGQIAAVTSPGQGRTAYTYGNWRFPTRCTYLNNPDAELDTTRWGVKSKKVYKVGGTALEATWTYGDALAGDPVVSGPGCSRYDYRTSWVNHPVSEGKYTRTYHYTNLTEGPQHPSPATSIDGPQVTDYGLPYRKDVRIGSGGDARFLSEQTYECDVATGVCTRKRRKYVRYEMGYRTCVRTKLGLSDSSDCYRVNPVLAAERTVYYDDGGRYLEKQQLRVDGAGNANLQIVRDNFAGSRDVRTSTDFTATGRIFTADPASGYFDFETPSTYLPGTAAPWILHRYDSVKVSEGGRDYVTDTQFNAQGSLTCSRRLLNPAGRGAKDLVTRLLRNSQGLVTTETVAGGDDGGLSTSLCSTNGSAAAGTRFDTTHGYQHLTLASSRIGAFPYSYRADVDRNTGLAKAIYDVAGQKTTLELDKLARIIRVEPQDTAQMAHTRVYYINQPGTYPLVDIRLRDAADTILHRVRHWYDHRGRTFQEGTYVTTSSGVEVEALINRAWDARGNLIRENSQQTRGSVDNSWSTRYSLFDAFGRPTKIVRPDGTVETRVYQGDRSVASTVQVRTTEGAYSPQTTTTQYDALGRDVQVLTPVYVLVKAYDPNGQVVTATRTSGTLSQTRGFGYDSRGFLAFEDLPEVGLNSVAAGRVHHRYDALGNLRRSYDGQRWLDHDYDLAGRPTAVREASRLWQSWAWGTANTADDFRLGRVVSATRFNHPGGDTWAFVESYAYNVQGRVREKTLQLEHPNRAGNDRFRARFAQSYDYNLLGQRTAVQYPECELVPGTVERYCNDPSDIQAPSHTVATTYSRGQTLRTDSNLGPYAFYAYHSNEALKSVFYGNGTSTSHFLDVGGTTRPRRINTGNGTATIFDSGYLSYDGAGNLWAAGVDRYTYDGSGRLLSGTVKQAGATRRTEYQLDPFDNITAVRRDGGTVWQPVQVNAKNRVLAAPGGAGLHYDAAGNLVRRGNVAASHEDYGYDALNMPTRWALVDGAGNLIDNQEHLYLYGPGNYRVLVFDGKTGKRHFLLRDLGGKPLREYWAWQWGPYNGPSNPGEVWTFERDYLYGPDGMFATVGLGGTQSYFHRDHLGSTRALTNGAGNPTYKAAFYPYGEEIRLLGIEGEDTSKFTGHERDRNGRTDYMLGRSYGIDLRQFMSVDPGRDGWNMYGYVGRNPIGFIDQTGRHREEPYLEKKALMVADASAVMARIGMGIFGYTGYGKAFVGGYSIGRIADETLTYVTGDHLALERGLVKLSGVVNPLGAYQGLKSLDGYEEYLNSGVADPGSVLDEARADVAGRISALVSIRSALQKSGGTPRDIAETNRSIKKYLRLQARLLALVREDAPGEEEQQTASQ